MTQDELIEAAAKAYNATWGAPRVSPIAIGRAIDVIEPLIRADERAKENEACARVAEKPHEHGGDGWAAKHEVALAGALAEGIAAAIRVRMGGE